MEIKLSYAFILGEIWRENSFDSCFIDYSGLSGPSFQVTCQCADVTRAFHVELRLQTERVEAVEEELPGEDVGGGHDHLDQHKAL